MKGVSNFPSKLMISVSLLCVVLLVMVDLLFSANIIAQSMMVMIGFIIGVLSLHLLQIHKIKLEQKNSTSYLENQFKIILNNKETLTFNKRVGGLVFLDYIQYMLVYNLNRDVFYVMKGEECLLTSNDITETETISDLKSFINQKYQEQINDCYIINNILYSKNIFDLNRIKLNFQDIPTGDEMDNFEDFIKEPLSFDVDTILDKISQNGIKSLTEEELKFLRDQK